MGFGPHYTARPTVSLSAADYFCQMLRKAWNALGKTPQFNAGFRKLARALYPPETGLGDMHPVEREMASLTSLGPSKMTVDLHCPRKECDKTDHLACKAYSVSTLASRSRNVLTVHLAAVRKTAGAGDQDTKDAALSALAQTTRDVGLAMSSATLARRQIWLAQTALPDAKRELVYVTLNMAIQTGNVFHPNTQAIFA